MVKKILTVIIFLVLFLVLAGGICYAFRSEIKPFFIKIKQKAEAQEIFTGDFYKNIHFPKFPKFSFKSKKITFTFWTIQLKAPAGHFIQRNIDAFKEAHPEIDEIVWVDIPIAEAQKRTLASVLSGNPPDLINLNPDFSSLLAQKGVLEYFTEEEIEAYHPELIEKLKFNGKVFALPFYATSPVTVYNKEVTGRCFKNNKLNFSSYEDIQGLSNQIKNCTSMSSIVINLNENDTFAKILNKYGVKNFSSEKEFQNTVKVVKMFDEMYKEGYLPKDTLTINHREAIEQYMAGNAIFIVAGSNFIKMIKENAPDIYAKSAISTQLSAPDGKYDVSLMNFVIPKNAHNKKLAKEFAFQITNAENQLKFAQLTNTLPVNVEVLGDEYFTNCPDDIIEKSRCEGAKQLNNLVKEDFGYNNKKAINDTLNKTLEEILLNPTVDDKTLESKLRSLEGEIKGLQKN